MRSSTGALLLGAAAALFDAGCKSKCNDAAPSVLLEVTVTDAPLASAIRALELSLELEGRRYRRTYAVGGELGDSRTAIVIDLDPAPSEATSLRVTVRAEDAGGATLAEETRETTVQPNACNTFGVVLEALAVTDAGETPDAQDAGDASRDDAARDGAAPADADGGGVPDADPADVPRADDAGARDVEAEDADAASPEEDAAAPDAIAAPVCGDGNTDPGETCDDDNLTDGDGCDSNCTPTGCGNGVPTAGEECDDGNTTAGDGCDASCGFEPIRRVITIDNSANALTLSNYPVLVALNTARAISEGKMQPDGDDLRVYAADGVTPIDFWIGPGIGTATTSIWVEVPSIPGSASTTIQVAYRDPAAASASNGEATFLYFADFDSSMLGDDGTQEGLSPLAGNWNVVADGRQGFGYEEAGTTQRQSVLGGASWSDVAVSVSVRLPLAVSGGVNGLYFRGTDLSNVYFYGPFQQNGVTFGKYNMGNYSALSELVFAVQREAWHEVTLAASGNTFRGYFDGALMITATDSSFSSGRIGLRTWGTNVRFDDLRVREYRSPEPTTAVGPEQ